MSKKQNKEQTQKSLGLPVDGGVPLMIVTEMTPEMKVLLEPIVEGLSAIGLQMIVVQPEDAELSAVCQSWQEQYPETLRMVEPSDAESMVADLEVLSDLSPVHLDRCIATSRVPVASGGLVEAFDPVEEKGNGFFYEAGNPWTLFAAVVRAVETYRFPYDWKNVLKAAKKSLKALSV